MDSNTGLSLYFHLKKKVARPLHLGRNRGFDRALGLRMAWLGLTKYQKLGLESLY